LKLKVAIARSLVNVPEVLIYDEPASGLDPLTTNYVLEFTRELSESGKTILFSAHNLYHVESVCDRVVIMNRGEIIARGTLADIRERHGETTYHVTTSVPVEVGARTTAAGAGGAVATAEGGAARAGARGSGPDADGRHVSVVDTMDEVEAVREAVERAGGEVVDIRTREPCLVDVFLDLARADDAERTDSRGEETR
jgi:ABC-2 type transport system ATP-binding protein